MSNIINHMREIGLTDFKKISEYFFKSDIDTIKDFDEYMHYLAHQDWNISNYSPYSFSPSMEVSGFGGCAEINCKIKRATQFNKYACLYSDTVYFIVDSITTPHYKNITENNENEYRYELMCDYSLILIYSELLIRGIAKIIPPHFSICKDCFSELIFNESEFERLETLVEDYSNKAILEALRYDDNRKMGVVTIKNLPELFFDHDGCILLRSKEGIEELNSIKHFPSIIDNQDFVKYLVQNHVYEKYMISKYETYISSAYQSKFITAKRFDKSIIDNASNGVIGYTPTPVFQMPFLNNIDAKTILKLREAEHHAFNDYRIALDNASKAYLANVENINASEIYDDIVYPAFVKLDAMFDRNKKMQWVKGIGELIVISSTVTLGLMNSIIPPNPLGIATALCGTGALVDHLANVADRKLNSGNELEKQDFYFLWQLNKKK